MSDMKALQLSVLLMAASGLLLAIALSLGWWCFMRRRQPAGIAEKPSDKIEVVVVVDAGPPAEKSRQDQDRVSCGAACDAGPRPYMEDAHVILRDVIGKRAIQALVGVFDGHGGDRASKLVANLLPGFIIESAGAGGEMLASSLARCESQLWADHDSGRGNSSGTTAVVAMLMGNTIFMANLGDCRAVLSQKGKATQITNDHKGTLERERVEAAGGSIDGEHYIGGAIGVSRALGDCHLEALDIKKRDGSGPLIASPEIHTIEVTPDTEFLLLGSDGIWDVISNQRASDIVRKSLAEGATPEQSAAKLVEEAKVQGTQDNATALVMTLCPLPLVIPKPPPRQLRNSRLRLAPRSPTDSEKSLGACPAAVV